MLSSLLSHNIQAWSMIPDSVLLLREFETTPSRRTPPPYAKPTISSDTATPSAPQVITHSKANPLCA
jgi:hypothetical protein